MDWDKALELVFWFFAFMMVAGIINMIILTGQVGH